MGTSVSLVVLEVVLELFDSVDGSNDSTDHTNDQRHGAPEHLIPSDLSPSEQLEVEQDGQDEDQRAVAQSAQQRQERAEEGHQASNTANNTHDHQTEHSAADPLLEHTHLLDSDAHDTLQLQCERGHQHWGSQQHVGNNHDRGDLATGTFRQRAQDGRLGAEAVGHVAGDGDHGVHDAAGNHRPDQDLVPRLGVSHCGLGMREHNVATKAHRDGGDSHGQVPEDSAVVGHSVLGILVIQPRLDHRYSHQNNCCQDSENTIELKRTKR